MGYRRADLWERFRKTRDVGLRNVLVERHLHVARGVVATMMRRLPRAIAEEELLSDAVVGLVRAVEAFDPSAGVRFETYASYRVRGSILDELRARDWVPRMVRKSVSRVKEAREQLARDGIEEPTTEEIALWLGETTATAEAMERETRVPAMFAFATCEENLHRESGDDGGGLALEDRRSAEPFEAMTARDLCARLTRGLTAKERAAVAYYYGEDRPMKEIGRILGVSESRVCQILAAAKAKMRRAATAGEAASAAAMTGA